MRIVVGCAGIARIFSLRDVFTSFRICRVFSGYLPSFHWCYAIRSVFMCDIPSEDERPVNTIKLSVPNNLLRLRGVCDNNEEPSDFPRTKCSSGVTSFGPRMQSENAIVRIIQCPPMYAADGSEEANFDRQVRKKRRNDTATIHAEDDLPIY